jgi:DNA-binding CsgD family transcriptional regulator
MDFRESTGAFHPKRYDVLALNIIAIFVYLYLAMFNPLNFKVYAALLFVYAVVELLTNEHITAFLMYVLSCLFLYRCGFFRTRMKLKIGVLTLIPVGCFCVQLFRFGFRQFLFNFMMVFALVIVCFLGFLLFLPEIWSLKQDRKKAVLSLSPEQFSERDALILAQILAGEKYDTIASEHGIAVSTLKNHLGLLYKKLQLADRTAFLIAYANHEIVFGKAAEPEQCVNSGEDADPASPPERC